MVKPWKTIRSEPLGDFRIFSIRSDYKISPLTGEEHDFFVIDTTDWVNVIAVTPGNELVMVEQYRHGSNTVELEIPGGMMDAGEQNPVSTGVRELREETGYEGEGAQVIGTVRPNPAIMSNLCHTVLVENCRRKHPVSFDGTEDIVTRLVPVTDIRRLVASGTITHSLVVVALYHFELKSHF